jgi:hypothetical protein
MAHDQEMFEKVEYLRNKADVSYEEAVQLLERYDGDLTRALIELERSGRIRPESAPEHEGREEARHDRRDSYTRHGSYHASRFLTVLFKNKLQVLKGEEIIASLPIAYYLFFALVAPHLFFFSIVLMFLCGCRIRRKQEPGSIREEDVSQFAANTARNIRTTVNSFTQTLKQEKPRQDDSSEDENEVTVD